jgi:hypothetical protein
MQGLRRAPYRLVLSSCAVGTTTPTGFDEMLGLVSVLAPLGTAGLLAAVALVNDAAVVPFSVALHQRLLAGATTPEALRDARLQSADDPVSSATAHAFVAFGAV